MAAIVPCSSAVRLPSFRARTLRARVTPASCRLTITKAHTKHATRTEQRDLLSGSTTPSSAAALAALAPLLAASAAHAEEATEAAAAVAGSGGAFGSFGSGEAALLLTPVAVYVLFNVYREKVNPKAQFLDYIYIMVFLAIVANLFSIVVFKTRFF